jgi:hypothetical protein
MMLILIKKKKLPVIFETDKPDQYKIKFIDLGGVSN